MRTKTSRRLAQAAALAAMALLATACGGDDDTKTVTAQDYRFEDLPSSVDAGTTLELENGSSKELHEMVVFRLPESEQRSVEELVKLPEEELGTLFSGPPAMVLLRPPGDAEQVTAVGDGKLNDAGRYVVICAIPTGADPAAYLAAAETSGDAPPDVPGGPPHFTQGMYGELTVE